MKKKILLLTIALLLLVTVAATAAKWSVGGAFGIDVLGGLPSSQAMVTFRLPFGVPLQWGLGMTLQQQAFTLGLTVDWWLFHSPLVGILSIYIGPGLYGAVGDTLELGGRIPVGLQVFPLSKEILEIFLEISPTLVFLSNSGITIPDFRLQAAFGFRFWFNS